MIDIDRFKNINDTYGHLLGDKAIAETGRILHNACSLTDVVARYGGDEFVIIRHADAKNDINDITKKIEASLDKLNVSGKYPFNMTYSYGSSTFDPDTTTIDDFIKAMDASMYENKRAKSKILPDRRSR